MSGRWTSVPLPAFWDTFPTKRTTLDGSMSEWKRSSCATRAYLLAVRPGRLTTVPESRGMANPGPTSSLANGLKMRHHEWLRSPSPSKFTSTKFGDWSMPAEKVRAVQFRYTYRHLLELTHQIVEILGTSLGLTWGPSVKSNCVVVHVLPERIDEVRRMLIETNPEDVRVEQGSPVLAL